MLGTVDWLNTWFDHVWTWLSVGELEEIDHHFVQSHDATKIEESRSFTPDKSDEQEEVNLSSTATIGQEKPELLPKV
jgi:hypothetical protein